MRKDYSTCSLKVELTDIRKWFVYSILNYDIPNNRNRPLKIFNIITV